MNLTLIFGLMILWSVALAYQVNEGEPNTPKFPLQPGDLLRSLDELTSDAQVIYSPLQETSGQSADRRVYHDDNTESNSELDYDRAYEDFVNKYFSQAEEDLNSDDDDDEKNLDIDDVAAYASSVEDDEDDDPGPKKRSSKSKICERVEIGDESCLVCENPKTNEKSKSCSYSSSSEPKSYGYTRERSSKRSSDDDGDDDDDDEDDSREGGKSLKREATPKAENLKIQPRRTSITSLLPPSIVAPENGKFSKCTRKKEGGMICYYCSTEADSSRECMAADKNLPKKRRLHESSKKGSKTKKVFKRMVRYSYNNDGEPKIKESTYAAVRGY